jgi:hypothetical protein
MSRGGLYCQTPDLPYASSITGQLEDRPYPMSTPGTEISDLAQNRDVVHSIAPTIFSAAIGGGKLVLAHGTTNAPGYNRTFFAAIIVT